MLLFSQWERMRVPTAFPRLPIQEGRFEERIEAGVGARGHPWHHRMMLSVTRSAFHSPCRGSGTRAMYRGMAGGAKMLHHTGTLRGVALAHLLAFPPRGGILMNGLMRAPGGRVGVPYGDN